MPRVHFQHHYGSKIIYNVFCYRESLPYGVCILSESKRPYETNWTLPCFEFFRLQLTCPWVLLTGSALVLTSAACQVFYFQIAWKFQINKKNTELTCWISILYHVRWQWMECDSVPFSIYTWYVGNVTGLDTQTIYLNSKQ